MKTIPKTWQRAVPKYPTLKMGCFAGIDGEEYWDTKGNFRLMTYCPYSHGYFESGWDYSGQEESYSKNYLSPKNINSSKSK